MTNTADLSPRQKQILNGVLSEVGCAISVHNARLRLEANNVSDIPLANPDLQPIAFAVRHTTNTYIYGVRNEITAWTVFFSAGLFLSLVIIGSIVLGVYGVYSGLLGLLGVGYLGTQVMPKLLEWLARIEHKFRRERWTARRYRHNAYKKLCADKRAPILYLRSFSFDPIYELPLELTRRVDERIAEYYDQYGPVIAIAGPDDKDPMPGPVKLYFDENNWRAGVIYLMSISQLVIIQAGISQGTLWELGIARQRLEPESLIISLADASNPNIAISYYNDFKPYAEVILGCELPINLDSNMHIRFGKNWEPLLYDTPDGLSFTDTKEQSRKQSYNKMLGVKTPTTQLYKTRYKECFDCGLYNWHEEVVCEFCGKILEHV